MSDHLDDFTPIFLLSAVVLCGIVTNHRARILLERMAKDVEAEQNGSER